MGWWPRRSWEWTIRGVAHVAHPGDWIMLEGLTIVPCLPVAHAVAKVLRWWFPLSTKSSSRGLVNCHEWFGPYGSCIKLYSSCLQQNQMNARPFRHALDTDCRATVHEMFDSCLATPSSCNIG
ncbi:hypothetical protein OIU84_005694 [Salix udensis]|uniref:Uncharacterized protein n=1 Tax=Salix udensis TaxID=889485 RepID=A0AAD6JX01_9ROSI|nr:hypothetical protein OIU84_005694 [Salix udensis]